MKENFLFTTTKKHQRKKVKINHFKGTINVGLPFLERMAFSIHTGMRVANRFMQIRRVNQICLE